MWASIPIPTTAVPTTLVGALCIAVAALAATLGILAKVIASLYKKIETLNERIVARSDAAAIQLTAALKLQETQHAERVLKINQLENTFAMMKAEVIRAIESRR